MEYKDFDKILKTLNKSPIREYLNRNENSTTLFEDERRVLNKIDDIIDTNKENSRNALKAVVLGEVKAGKSTLINSLVQKQVVYTNVVEATASIIEVKYSKDENIFIEGKNGSKERISSLKELNKLMDEKRTYQEFFNNIKHISISTNTEKLRKITIVDTPGLNTITSENAKRTDEYIKNADVILWVLNGHNLGQNDVIEKIEEVMEYGKPIIGVVNRVDEIDADKDEILEYVQDEMGYIFNEVFITSAKEAWDGFIEENNIKTKNSNINDLYEFIINNIESKSEEFQTESLEKSTIAQIDKDLYIHKNTKNKLETMINKMDEDDKSLRNFNFNIKEIAKNKIEEWLNLDFFKEEKNILVSCKNSEEYNKILKQYCNDQYLKNIINAEYTKISKYIMEEWKKQSDEFIAKKVDNIDFSIHIDGFESTNTLEVVSDEQMIEGAKNGGIAAGAVGLGLAGYAAWLGPAAAYVTIGGAIGAFVPPLAIAGAVGGAVWTYLKRDKQKSNQFSQVEVLVKALKDIVKNNILENMIDELNKTSDYYYKCTSGIISDILTQCNTSKEEIEDINNNLSKYIDNVEVELIDLK